MKANDRLDPAPSAMGSSSFETRHATPLAIKAPPAVEALSMYERMFDPIKVAHHKVMQKTADVLTEIIFIEEGIYATEIHSAGLRLESVDRLGRIGAQYSYDPAVREYYPVVAQDAMKAIDGVRARLHGFGLNMILDTFEHRD